MKVGDLVKLICKDGAVHFEVGIFLGKSLTTTSHHRPFAHRIMHSFFIEGKVKQRSSLVYDMAVINESR
jgi:hypothetical protein